VLRLQGYDRSTQSFQTEYIYPADRETSGEAEARQFPLFTPTSRERKGEPYVWDPSQAIE
jgi:hypothetical protein